jgi:hypothetical protein
MTTSKSDVAWLIEKPFARVADNYEASIERANRALLDEAKVHGRSPPEDHLLKQPLPDSHRVSVSIGDCRRARAALSQPQSDDATRTDRR